MAPADSTGMGALFQDVYEDAETTEYLDGSAKIALGLPEPFDYYLFIDKSRGHVRELEGTIQREHPGLLHRCNFRRGNANVVLKAWCKERDWQKERAVVFLDPFGMQVEWSSVEALAGTEGVDLWYLFPLGIGVSRLLTHRGEIEEAWQRRLDLLFGTADWRSEFYRVTVSPPDLFGTSHEMVERDASIEKIKAFIHKRLAGVFEKAAQGLESKELTVEPAVPALFRVGQQEGCAHCAPDCSKYSGGLKDKDRWQAYPVLNGRR